MTGKTNKSKKDIEEQLKAKKNANKKEEPEDKKEEGEQRKAEGGEGRGGRSAVVSLSQTDQSEPERNDQPSSQLQENVKDA